MEFDDDDSAFCSSLPPALVSLHNPSSFSPSPRRLSSCFTQPNKPVRAKRQLAWLSLQGRLVGAEEATSAKTIDINGIFSANEAVAWELFTPIQRVLVVAAVAAAVAKDKEIVKLRRSVQFRDQILLNMQQKLDNLCDQVNYFKDSSEVFVTSKDVALPERAGRGCQPCQPQNLSADSDLDKTSSRGSHGEMFKYEMLPASVAEPEERRMSDLSDWAPSITSSADIQLDTLAFEHDISSLQKQCEEKDITIEKLSTLIQSSEVSGSKRIAELEDIIRRKNMIITKLRKDVLILEQKMVNLTRLRRPSVSAAAATSNVKPIPFMADNVIYDMDSTTSPSSSDSDSPRKNQCQIPKPQPSEKSSNLDRKCGQYKGSIATQLHQTPIATSPLKERSLNSTPNSVPSLRTNHSSTSSGENRSRRRPPARAKDVTAPARAKDVTAPKRWV